ncbi:MAG: glucokinase [Lewinellaceae bacterium]|nr:glucokinase [Lewinellaceae bacterium]
MNSAPILKIAFPKHLPLPEGETVLAADVGGTKTALALYEMRGGAMSLLRRTVYASNKFTSLEEAIRHFTGTSPLPARLSIAFAGPVQDGKAKATNLGWSIDIDALSRELGVSRVFLLNDLEAGAYGLAALNPQDFLTVYPGKTPATGNAAIIAPGTGLGEGGLYWDGSTFHPFATEGGHSAFAPVDAFDAELMLFLQSQYSRVSWERVVSGPGILRIYTFLRDIKNRRRLTGWKKECGHPTRLQPLAWARRKARIFVWKPFGCLFDTSLWKPPASSSNSKRPAAFLLGAVFRLKSGTTICKRFFSSSSSMWAACVLFWR